MSSLIQLQKEIREKQMRQKALLHKALQVHFAGIVDLLDVPALRKRLQKEGRLSTWLGACGVGKRDSDGNLYLQGDFFPETLVEEVLKDFCYVIPPPHPLTGGALKVVQGVPIILLDRNYTGKGTVAALPYDPVVAAQKQRERDRCVVQ